MIKNPEQTEKNAAEYSETAQSIVSPIYPLIAHHTLKKGNSDTGRWLDTGTNRGGDVRKIADELNEAGFDIKEQMDCYVMPDDCKPQQRFKVGRRFAATVGEIIPAGSGD